MMEQGPPQDLERKPPEPPAGESGSGRRVLAILLVLFISPFLLFWGACAIFALGSNAGALAIIVVPLLGLAVWITVAGVRALWRPRPMFGSPAVVALWLLAIVAGIAYVAALTL